MEIKGRGAKDIGMYRNVTSQMAQDVGSAADRQLDNKLRQARQKT